jgi:hypothetical protein
MPMLERWPIGCSRSPTATSPNKEERTLVPAWATIVITLGASAIAVAGTLAATILQQRFARREREAAEAEEWVKAGAEILGPIDSLLVDAHPERVSINLNEESLALMQYLREDRWQGQLRDRLATLGVAHPLGEVRAKAIELGVAIHNSLHATSWLVRDMLRKSELSEIDRARAEHAVAQERASELGDLIHRFKDQQRGNKTR